MIPPSEYLRRVLRLDPVRDAEGMLALRRRHHGRAAVEAVRPAPAPRAPREEVMEALHSIRRRIHADPPDRLASEIAGLNVEGRPDLRDVARRLQAVLDVRDELRSLDGQRWMPAHFRTLWLESLIALPSEAGVLRRTLHDDFGIRTRLNDAAAIVWNLKTSFPRLYALDKAWLEEFGREPTVRYPRSSPSGEPGTTAEAGNPGSGILYKILIGFLVIRLIAALFK